MALADLVEASDGRLRLIEGDALEVDPEADRPCPAAIVANLPYNVATPLLIGWLKRIEQFRSLTLMFQREVADRLSAKPGTKAYGRLSVLAQHVCSVQRLFDVAPSAFVPRPRSPPRSSG